MTFFRFRWLHRFIRRNTKPIAPNVAESWKQRLSIVYMVLAWNAFGAVLYLTFTGKGDLGKYYGLKTEEEINKQPAVYYAELLGIKKAHVISVKQFQKVDEFDYEEKKKETQD